MKTLLVMRHAKSDWGHARLTDHDRPLNDRGLRDAPRMGAWIRERVGVVDRILTSTATRATGTALLVAEGMGYTGEVQRFEELYLVGPTKWMEIVRAHGGTADRLLTVSHNPGVEDIVELLSGQSHRVSTATVARFHVKLEDWKDLDPELCQINGVWRPKDVLD